MTITFITGGAKSGKSRHALELADGHRRKVFIATAEPIDEEMAHRIERHRTERDPSYVTVEEPYRLAHALRELPTDTEVVVIDCLTVWLGNLMHRHGNAPPYLEVDAFIEALHWVTCPVIIVSNELGLGIVPENELARQFRDLAGSLNQQIARLAHQVVLVVSGIPMTIKDTQP